MFYHTSNFINSMILAVRYIALLQIKLQKPKIYHALSLII